MTHKRIHVRVPISGEAIVSNKQGTQTKTRTIDISPGGIGIISPSDPLGEADYQIEVITANGDQIQFSATLIREDKQSVGFKTSDIDQKNLQTIADLVAEFQTTEEFIKQIDEHDLLEQSFVDKDGNKVSVTFEIDPET